MYRRHFLFYALIILTLELFSYSFVVRFEDLSDKNPYSRYKGYDVNGDLTGMIRIESDLDSIDINSNMGYAKRIKEEKGYVYLFSPDDKRITIKKTGFITCEYPLPKKIYSGCFYILKITSDKLKDSAISFKSPYSIDVYLKGEKIGTTPLDNYEIFSGEEEFSFKINNKEIYSETIEIVEGDNLYNLKLGSIRFLGANDEVDIQLDSINLDLSAVKNIIPQNIGKHEVIIFGKGGSIIEQKIISVSINRDIEYHIMFKYFLFTQNGTDLRLILAADNNEYESDMKYPLDQKYGYRKFVLADLKGKIITEFNFNTDYDNQKNIGLSRIHVPAEYEVSVFIDDIKFEANKSNIFLVPKTHKIEIYNKKHSKVFNEVVNFNSGTGNFELIRKSEDYYLKERIDIPQNKVCLISKTIN